MKNYNSLDNPMCWGQGHQCGSKSNTLCDEDLRVRNKTRYAKRERERKRGTKNKLYSRRQQLQMTTTTTFTEG